MKKFYTFLILLAATLTAAAQERVINGIVMDGELENEPLIGATVSVGDGKGGMGTATDYVGKFSLKVPAGTRQIAVSYVGYNTKVIDLKPGINDYHVTLSSWAK